MQPPLTRKYLDPRANKKGITMVEEIVKMVLSASFFISCGKSFVRIIRSEIDGHALVSIANSFWATLWSRHLSLAKENFDDKHI